MFNDIVGRMACGDLQEEFDKIDKVKEWGYNVCYDVVGGEIVYKVDEIKKKMIRVANNDVEVAMIHLMDEIKGERFGHVLKNYDYKERAINENSKSMVMFLAVFGGACIHLSYENKGIEQSINEALEGFTEGKYSFGDLVGYGQHFAKLNLSEEFFEVCMDYIINVLLKYKF